MNEKVEASRREIVQEIINRMEQGDLFWQRGWDLLGAPYNPVSGSTYTMGNRLRLSMTAQINGYDDPRWCTFNHAKSQGWHIKKGERATLCERWIFEKEEKIKDTKTGEETKVKVPLSFEDPKHKPFVVPFYVFNASQIEGIPPLPKREPKPPDETLALVEQVIASSSCTIDHNGGDRAFYHPAMDAIHLPNIDLFHSHEEYAATVLHEMGHSTGHPSRLNRDLTGRFGSEKYAKEELVAEFCSVFTYADLGISLADKALDNNSAYLKSWVSILREDPDALFRAANQASEAARYIEEQYARHYNLEMSRDKETNQLIFTPRQQENILPSNQVENIRDEQEERSLVIADLNASGFSETPCYGLFSSLVDDMVTVRSLSGKDYTLADIAEIWNKHQEVPDEVRPFVEKVVVNCLWQQEEQERGITRENSLENSQENEIAGIDIEQGDIPSFPANEDFSLSYVSQSWDKEELELG